MTSKLRDRLALGLAYGTGMRPGEVLRLRVKHIDSERMIIRVEQLKGKKDRGFKTSAVVGAVRS